LFVQEWKSRGSENNLTIYSVGAKNEFSKKRGHEESGPGQAGDVGESLQHVLGKTHSSPDILLMLSLPS